jgi:hypothetical protein
MAKRLDLGPQHSLYRYYRNAVHPNGREPTAAGSG